MKFFFLLGSRAEWGYVDNLISTLIDAGHQVDICATNAAVLEEFGNLANKIDKNFKVRYQILSSYSGDSRASMSKSIGSLISSLTDLLTNEIYDWVVLAGDRAEQLAGAVASGYLYIPIAHIQAGERSGSIDDRARHAIARFSSLHLTSNADATQRLLWSGEQDWRIHEVGAPQLDDFRKIQKASSSEILEKRGLTPSGYFLVCMHSTTDDLDEGNRFTSQILEFLAEKDLPCVWVLPNNDAGSSIIRETILKYGNLKLATEVNLRRDEYLHLLKNSKALLGNTSSGIIESASFNIPTANLGTRQRNRIRPNNVLDILRPEEFQSKIEIILSGEFIEATMQAENPYGDGLSTRRIKMILESNTDRAKLVLKELSY